MHTCRPRQQDGKADHLPPPSDIPSRKNPGQQDAPEIVLRWTWPHPPGLDSGSPDRKFLVGLPLNRQDGSGYGGDCRQ